MALTFSNAVTIAQMELNMIQRFSNNFILLPEQAHETPCGWLIPWAQNDFRFTKEVRLAGNSPFFIDRFTGEVSRVNFSQLYHFEEWLEQYAKNHGYKV